MAHMTQFRARKCLLGVRNNKTANIYVKNCSVYTQHKGDIVVGNIKQHKSQLKNSNITIRHCQKKLCWL